MKAHHLLRASLGCGVLLLPMVATAQNDLVLEEIIVTATKTGETTVQRTPLAISAFSADQLDSSLVVNVKDLVAVTPNLSVAQVTASAVIYMRGIGSSNVFGGSDPSVTTQIDGVYIARAFGQFQDFVDIQRVEVLRGPQGTLYGRNAVGGTINIISKKPSDEFTGKIQLTGGDYDHRQGQFYVSGPLVEEKVQASLSGTLVRHDDYIDNVIAGLPGVNNARRGGVRGQLRFVPTNNVEMITRVDYNEGNERFDSYSHLLVPFRPGGTNPAPLASGLVGDYTKVALNAPQVNKTKLWGLSQEINVDLSDDVSLKSLTAYRRSKYGLFVDSDGTELQAQISNQNELSRQFSQELNLTGNFDRFNGVLGLFYFYDKTSTVLQSTNFPNPPVVPAANAFYIRTVPDSYSKSFAAFAQGTYKLTDDLGLTVGARFTKDIKEIDQNFNRVSLATNASTPGFPFVYSLERKFDAVTPKFGVDYQITPNVMVYASATRGFKSGGTSIFANNAADLSFDPENIWAYEGGFKSDLLDRRLRFNTSVFRYNYRDLQVQSLIAPGVVAIRNAANARVTGVEFEANARPTSNLQLGANLSFLNTKYRSFPASSVPNQLVSFVTGDPNFNATTRTYNASGNRLNAAPKYSFSGNAQYNFPVGPGEGFIRGEYYRQGKVYYDASNAAIFSQKGYELINGSVGWNNDDGTWGVQLVGKNLAKEQYLITIAANGLVPAGLAGAPRTFVVQLSHSW